MNPALSGLIGFIAQTLIIWLALSIILYAVKPQFWYVDGKVDLWTVFWVSLVLAIFTAIITTVISWYNTNGTGMSWDGSNNNCQPQCQPQCNPAPPACPPQKVVMECMAKKVC